jgi:hypothetical protein
VFYSNPVLPIFQMNCSQEKLVKAAISNILVIDI